MIVGFVVGLSSSIYPSALGRKMNANGVVSTFSMTNRFLIPAVTSTFVSAIVQGVGQTVNGSHNVNRMGTRTAVQQGGWQIIGLLITLGTALLAGLIIGLLYKVINKNTHGDQFNDEVTYSHVPTPALETD